MMPSALWSVLMAVLMFIPGSGYPSLSFSGTDFLVHVVLFAFWAFLTVQGLYKQAHWPALRFYRGFAVVLLGVLWGVVLELIQGFLLWERSAGLDDYLADIVGIFGGLFVFERLVKASRGRR